MATDTTTARAAPHDQQAQTARASLYFSRRLTVSDEAQGSRSLGDGEILDLAGNKILLGEPGMGKTKLIRELGRRLDIEPITAIRFISAKTPARYVTDGQPLLIDGLDEAMSRREGDAIDAILAQLEDADWPPFILSCRSREWQARSLTNLRQLYGAEPQVLTLEPLDRHAARAFMLAHYPSVDGEHVLDHLERHMLQDLYRNPLTLGLMGRVAAVDAQLAGDTRRPVRARLHPDLART